MTGVWKRHMRQIQQPGKGLLLYQSRAGASRPNQVNQGDGCVPMVRTPLSDGATVRLCFAGYYILPI
jgi:hypothetical protein